MCYYQAQEVSLLFYVLHSIFLEEQSRRNLPEYPIREETKYGTGDGVSSDWVTYNSEKGTTNQQ